MKRLFFIPLTILPLLVSAQTLSIDAADITAHVPNLIYGAGAEDVNHEIYGGLYDQRIFGEGFEEPAVSGVKGFTAYDNKWSMSGDVLQIVTSAFGKLIYNKEVISQGVIDVDIRLDSANPIAGLIFNVSGEGNGADAFNGYEVSLNAATKKLVYGKHQQNWQHIAEKEIDFNPKEWNNLRVEYNGSDATVLVNGTQIFSYSDADSPLSNGKIGLRSYGGSASYRNLKVNGETVELIAEPLNVAGFSQYDNDWTVENGMLKIETMGFGKIIYESQHIERGTVEVEMHLDSEKPIAGLIFDVREEGTGADSFRGYEVSLNAEKKTFVFGKHDHNWQPIANKNADFNADEWNKLRIVFDGKTAVVYLNDNEIFNYTDNSSSPLMAGKIGLRSYGGSASFRNLKINGSDIEFAYAPVGVSKMWVPVGNGTFVHDGTTALTGQYSQKISGTSGVGIANKGLNRWGIALDGQPMQGCVYLKGDCNKAFVALQNADGTKEYARQELSGVTSEWQRFGFEMTPNAADSLARFVVGLASEGNMWVDQAMLYTDSYPFRKDLTEAFKQQKLTFLRYGGTMVNAPEYMTKNMIGNRELREPYIGHWYYNSTNGFAIPEFVRFARMIGTEPTFAINVEDNPTDVLALLKEIEPYNLRYIEIGNEECIWSAERAGYEHYVERFNVLYDAIHAAYPDLKFITAAWWRPDEPETMEYVFRQLDGKCDLWDYHPWTETFEQAKAAEKEIQAMQAMFKAWNPNTTMRCAILEENGNTHDMARALAHAEMLNIVRRMNGFVELDSPANALQPYMQNDNGWDQGQIFFSPASTWNQPPYYAQQIASKTHLPLLVRSAMQGKTADATVTRNQAGDTLAINIVNSSASPRNIKMVISNFGAVKEIKSYSVSAESLDDRNTPQQPEKIIAKEESLSPNITSLPVKPYSYTVFIVTSDTPAGIEKKNAENNLSDEISVYDLQGRKLSVDGNILSPNTVYIKNGRKELKSSI
jgi:alpha-L-arabinofuranosidase